MDYALAVDRRSASASRSTLCGTVAVVDLVGYSSIAKVLEENISTASVADLNHQIQTFINLALDSLPDALAYRIIAWTGDGAIVFFNSAQDAHNFSQCVHVFAHEHTGQRSERTAERWFRIGISTGKVSLSSAADQSQEYAGIAIANAKRLEASATPGEIVVDEDTFAGLKNDTKSLYGTEEIVPGKREEKFRVRRCRVTRADARKPDFRRLTKPTASTVMGVALGLALALFSVFLIPAVAERARGVLFSSKEKHIAVLPLDVVAGDAQSQALGDGLMDSLAGRLSNLDPADQSLFVVPASEVRDRKIADPAAALHELGATIVVKARFGLDQQNVKLELTVIDPIKNRDIGYSEVSGQTGDLAALEDEAVAKLGRLMNISAKENMGPRNERSVTSTAYDDYLAGVGYFARNDKAGNIDLAIASLQRAVRADPHFALAFARLAQIYTMKSILTSSPESLRQAEMYGKQALNLDSQLPSAHVALGEIYELQGSHDVAIEQFHEAISLNPRDPEAVTGIADLYEKAEKNTEAEIQYKKAASLLPEYWKGYNDLGNFYEDVGRPREAISQYEHALQLAPENSWVYANLGIAYLDLDDPKMLDNAEKALKRSVGLNPSFVAFLYLGSLYAEKHQFKESVDASEQAVLLNERSYQAWYNLAESYEWLDESEKASYAWGKASEIAESRVKTDPQNEDAQAALASLYARRGDRSKAKEKLATLVLPSSSRYVYNQLADTYELLGERKKAVASLQQAMRLGLNLGQIKGDPELRDVLTDITRAKAASQ